MLGFVMGILFFGSIGVWQIFISNRYFKHLKKNGNAATSNFAPMALFTSYRFGLLMLFLAFSIFLSLVFG